MCIIFYRSFITAAEVKLKAELKTSNLTQLDKKRLTMCTQELVGKPEIHTHCKHLLKYKQFCSVLLLWPVVKE